jgi:hypothetical protein
MATVVETDEEIRAALLSIGRRDREGDAPAKADVSPHPAVARTASPYRPTARPVVPILTVFDDGKTDGETIRVRDARFVIGRNEGDLRFPLDGRMSSRHVEITHQVVGGVSRWVVTDLQSTHGMFVRVSRTALADRAEFLVGSGRYRFEAPTADPNATVDHLSQRAGGSTHGWDDGSRPFRPPALTELVGNEIGNRVVLAKDEYWIGADPSCAIARTDDPFCESRHARLFRNARGGWSVEHDKSLNGLWLRMPQIAVESVVHFQAGEQRFRIRVP